MLRTIFVLLLLGALVNGEPPELVTPSKLLEDFTIDSSKKRRSRTHVDTGILAKKGRNLFNSGEAGETFMSKRLDENARSTWENGSFNALKNGTPTPPNRKTALSQQVPGGEINYGFDTTGLFSFLSNLQKPDHYLYALYNPIGTAAEQYKSCFYIGVSNNIRHRLSKHSSEPKKGYIQKWHKFHGKDRLEKVGICQLFKGSKGDCLILEKQLIGQGDLLGLDLVNVDYKIYHKQKPDPSKTGFFRQMLEIGLESGQKFDITTKEEEVSNTKEVDQGSDIVSDMECYEDENSGDMAEDLAEDDYEDENSGDMAEALAEDEGNDEENGDNEDEREETEYSDSEYDIGDLDSDYY